MRAMFLCGMGYKYLVNIKPSLFRLFGKRILFGAERLVIWKIFRQMNVFRVIGVIFQI